MAVLVAVISCATQAPATISSTTNYEGLADVRKPHFDVAQVRPNTAFSRYDGVIVNAPDLAFQTPDRLKKQFPLDDEQKRRFEEALAGAFSSEFKNLKNLDVKVLPGPGVLELMVRVENITATVPSGQGTQLGFALTAVGEATLIIELSDSESGEILARGVETRAVQGAALGQDGGVVTRWEDIEKLCSRWASMARSRLDVLIGQG